MLLGEGHPKVLGSLLECCENGCPSGLAKRLQCEILRSADSFPCGGEFGRNFFQRQGEAVETVAEFQNPFGLRGEGVQDRGEDGFEGVLGFWACQGFPPWVGASVVSGKAGKLVVTAVRGLGRSLASGEGPRTGERSGGGIRLLPSLIWWPVGGLDRQEGCAMDRRFTILATWDAEAGVWVATSEEVLGLATEADTIPDLVEKLERILPELLVENGQIQATDGLPEVPFWIMHEHVTRSSAH